MNSGSVSKEKSKVSNLQNSHIYFLWNTVRDFVTLFTKCKTYFFHVIILSFFIIILSYKEIILSFKEIRLFCLMIILYFKENKTVCLIIVLSFKNIKPSV